MSSSGSEHTGSHKHGYPRAMSVRFSNELLEQMRAYPEINWSEVMRSAAEKRVLQERAAHPATYKAWKKWQELRKARIANERSTV